jgi:hypothetical protein
MDQIPFLMKKNPENNKKAAKNPLESKKRGGYNDNLRSVIEFSSNQREHLDPDHVQGLTNSGYKEYTSSDGGAVFIRKQS